MNHEEMKSKNIGYYNKDSERIVQEKKVHCQTHHQTYQDMSIHQLKVVGANTRTLVWEYLSAHMDYENKIHAHTSEIAEEIEMSRQETSKALTHLVKNYCLMQIGGNIKGRTGREFMVNPYYRNRGSSKDVHRKKKTWDALSQENDPLYREHVLKIAQEERENRDEEANEKKKAFFRQNPPPTVSKDQSPDDPMPF